MPLVYEGNLAAAELNRNIKFNTKLVKRLDPFLKDGLVNSELTDVVVKIENNEDFTYYEWPGDKF